MIYKTFDEVFTYENLYKGHLKARLCKRGKKPLINFENKQIANIYEIYLRLKNGGSYKYKYHAFRVHEPKEREIQTLCYSDRIIQRVLCDEVLMPYFSNHAIIDNCACQKGKGTHFALDRFENMLQQHIHKYGVNGYFLKCDILKYFPTIPHDMLKQFICTHIKDERLREFVEGIIDSYHTKPEYLKKHGLSVLGYGDQTNRGIPIGNQTSQVFGMFYLNPIDRFVKEKMRIKVYSRYMDDFIIVHQDKQFLTNILQDIQLMVEELGLKLNDKTQLFPLKNGVTYLGFRFKVTESGKIVRTVKKQTKRRMRWRVKLLKKAYMDGIIDSDRVLMSYSAMYGHLCHSHGYKLDKEIFKKLQFIIAKKITVKRRKNAGRK
jgi:hypothetical protein